MDDYTAWLKSCDELLPGPPWGRRLLPSVLAVGALLLAVTGCGAAALAAWSQVLALASAAAS